MALLVTVARYRIITGDEDTGVSAVEEAITDAQAMLEEELGGRRLEQKSRVEEMRPDPQGRLYPRATPIVSVEAGYTIDGATLRGKSPFPFESDWLGGLNLIDVTYTGGYVERSQNLLAANRLPVYVERDIAWAARRLLSPTQVLTGVPAGAKSVRLGDAAVTFGDDTPSGGAEAQVGGWSDQTLRLRRRRL